MISAKVICHSVSPRGKKLLTYELRYPKFIHGEFMTHRLLSRNASSSRAIPTAKLLEEVRSPELRAGPVFWGKNEPGMQAAVELSESERAIAISLWGDAAENAARIAEAMLIRKVHKQVVNRLLEPFSHINVVASATEWDNFFGLRLDRAAQPEMRALALAMWEAMGRSIPRPLTPGTWHLPYLDAEDDALVATFTDRIKISVARCARVSYRSFETGVRSTVAEDLALYDRLMGAQPLHASPAEHQATPDSPIGDLPHEAVNPQLSDGVCVRSIDAWNYPEQHGNFVGWRQYRKMIPGEAVAPLPKDIEP